MSREVNMRRSRMNDKSKEENISRAFDMRDNGSISTDPFGSWTGASIYDEYDEPIQDVDDL